MLSFRKSFFRLKNPAFNHNGYKVGERMLEQFLMYWLLWIIFIVVTFFMEKNSKRYVLTSWILFIICFSSLYITISEIELSVALLIILFGSFIYLVEVSFSMLQLTRAITVMISYCSLLIWEMLSPVWFFIPAYFLIPVILIFLTFILSHPLQQTYAFMLLGITLGQVLFDLLLSMYQLNQQIGMTSYFIYISLTTLLLISIRAILLLYTNAIHFIHRKLI